MDDLLELEERLREALRHVPAPAGFAQRVVQRVANTADEAAAPSSLPRPATLLHMPAHARWWGAAAAILVLTVAGSDALHVEHRHRAEQERAASAQVDLAMRLTNHALTEVELEFDRSPAGRFTQVSH